MTRCAIESMIKRIEPKFEVIEDNGGGLSLLVYDDDNETIKYMNNGYEYVPESLIEDIEILANGKYPVEKWDGNILENSEMCESVDDPKDRDSWFPFEHFRFGWDIVADNCGLYPEDMGESARKEFHIEDV